MNCELASFGGCGGPMDRHHVLNRAKLQKIPGALAYCDAHPLILLAHVCRKHDAGTKFADSKKARRFLVQQRVQRFGRARVERVLDGLRELSKLESTEWTLDGILATG